MKRFVRLPKGTRLSPLLLLVLARCVASVEPELDDVPELAVALDRDPAEREVDVSLAAGPAWLEILPGVGTAGLAYHEVGRAPSSSIVGPLIEVNVGQTLTIWLRNDMPVEETSLHLHGMRVPADLDANPLVTVPIEPGRTRVHRFVVRDPGLYWFHPHVFSDVQVERGLQGLVIARAEDEPRAARERVLVFDDVDLAPDGSIAIEASHDDHHFGRFGSELLVNGRPPGRTTAIAGSIERWRLANTANGRHFALALSGARPFAVIGWDGPPLEEPYTEGVLELAPGERRDVLVELDGAPGESIWLETRARERGGDAGVWEAAPLIRIDLVAGDPGPRVRAADFARTVERLTGEGPMRALELGVDLHAPDGERMTINGDVWPFGDAIEARYGATEIWSIANPTDMPHPFHLHGTFFQLLDRDGVAQTTIGWRDTVAIGPFETIRFAVRYDAIGRWMFHCQIPEHAHMGMMGDLVIGD